MFHLVQINMWKTKMNICFILLVIIFNLHKVEGVRLSQTLYLSQGRQAPPCSAGRAAK